MITPTLQPARRARARDQARLLVIEPGPDRVHLAPWSTFASLLEPGDLIVLNDAATLPASLQGEVERPGALIGGRAPRLPIEVRLAGTSPRGYWAVLFGPGSWRQRTEDRLPPPRLDPGERVQLGSLTAEILAVDPDSPRLVELAFLGEGSTGWAGIYREGRVVQYAYHQEPLGLWSVQNAYAGPPVAFEMPSAGRALTVERLLELRRRGVEVVALTHEAGLSSTGDPQLDARLPLPEHYAVPEATWSAVTRTRAAGRRVIAVGTSVVRALESAHHLGARVGLTTLRLGPQDRLAVVDGILTGMHVEGESHYELLHTFASPELLRRGNQVAAAGGLLSHEFGDLTLILPPAQIPAVTKPRNWVRAAAS